MATEAFKFICDANPTTSHFEVNYFNYDKTYLIRTEMPLKDLKNHDVCVVLDQEQIEELIRRLIKIKKEQALSSP